MSDDLIERLRWEYAGTDGRLHGLRGEAADRIEALEAENKRLHEALAPFSIIAGEMFARNLNRNYCVVMLEDPDGSVLRLDAGDFFAARNAAENTATFKRLRPTAMTLPEKEGAK